MKIILNKPSIVVCAVLAAGSLAVAADPIEERLQEYERRLDELTAEVERLREELAAERTRRREAEQARAPAEEQDRKIGILAQEIEKIRDRLVLPEKAAYKSRYGLGPAASKVYGVERGLSIGGYGEANYSNVVSDKGGKSDRADFLRFVLYTGYKFSDWILLNTELEFEHATTSSTASGAGEGEVSLEFAYLDFLLSEYANVRAGLVLIPMGFLNEMHEPPFFHGNIRPFTERVILPTTFRENGVGLFGNLGPDLAYRGYVTNSLVASGFRDSGTRDARQKGSRALAEDLAGSFRLDYTPGYVPGLLLGGSFFVGDTGQDEEIGEDGVTVDAALRMWELHGQYRHRGLELRTLGAFVELDDAAILSAARGETIAENMFGWYAEAAYDLGGLFWPERGHYLAPFFRYEIVDTQDKVPAGFERNRNRDVDVIAAGLSWKPHTNVVLKFDYRGFDADEGSVPDELNLGLGFIF